RIHVTLNHMLLKGPPHIGPQLQDAIAAPVMAVLSVGRFAFFARAMSPKATWIRCGGAAPKAPEALRGDGGAGRRNKTAKAVRSDFLPTLFGAIRVGCSPVERHRSDWLRRFAAGALR